MERFGGFSDKTPWARAYKKVRDYTTTIICINIYYYRDVKALWFENQAQNFGKTSKPSTARAVDVGQRA
jgi:hypothetical protein